MSTSAGNQNGNVVLEDQRQLEFEAARKLALRDPLALLVALACDQQARVEVAFVAPLRLQRHFGSLDVAVIAQTDLSVLAEALEPLPGTASLHRNPKDHPRSRKLAERTRRLCGAIAAGYGGDAAALWRDAQDMQELDRRLGALPGIGRRKTEALSLLAKPGATNPDALAAYIRSRACTRGRWRARQAPERERLLAEGRRWLNNHGEPLTHDRWRSLQESGGASSYPSLQAIRAHFGGFPLFREAVETQAGTNL